MTATTRIEYTGNIQVHHPIMTAAELQVIARDASDEAALFVGRADQAWLRGITVAADKI